jgi:hypothetical protein
VRQFAPRLALLLFVILDARLALARDYAFSYAWIKGGPAGEASFMKWGIILGVALLLALGQRRRPS